jgi:hypothetical protein
MADLNQPNDVLSGMQEKPKLPGSLNVLTILTYIGCALGLCWTFGSFAFMNWSMRMMSKAEENGNLTEKQLADMEKGKVVIQKMMENKAAIIVIWLAGIALCFYGAMMMRKLKKEGYYIYIVGQILPIIASIILLGSSNVFSGISNYIFTLGLPALFIILYGTNLKYLK